MGLTSVIQIEDYYVPALMLSEGSDWRVKFSAPFPVLVGCAGKGFSENEKYRFEKPLTVETAPKLRRILSDKAPFAAINKRSGGHFVGSSKDGPVSRHTERIFEGSRARFSPFGIDGRLRTRVRPTYLQSNRRRTLRCPFPFCQQWPAQYRKCASAKVTRTNPIEQIMKTMNDDDEWAHSTGRLR